MGSNCQCDYKRYAHKAVAGKAGLPQPAIDALAQGIRPEGVSDEELLAWELAEQICRSHKVSEDLFRRAQAAFGNRGIVDLIFLAGCYLTVCSLLNAFEVPVPDQGAAN